jgi:hypothetical protein
MYTTRSYYLIIIAVSTYADLRKDLDKNDFCFEYTQLTRLAKVIIEVKSNFANFI